MPPRVTRRLAMLDLFAGLGGASEPMTLRGWRVVRVDLARHVAADIVADVATLPIRGRFDLIWASPPCVAYARAELPWIRDRSELDASLALVADTVRAIRELAPRAWVIENTRFGSRYLGDVLGAPIMHCGSWVFWGDFPLPLFPQTIKAAEKLGPSPLRPWLRACIPYPIAESFAIACEDSFSEEALR